MKTATPELRDVTPDATASEALLSTATPPDPFDLANLRLNSNFAETVGVKKLLKVVPVKKPGRQEFIRVHPDPAFRDNFSMVELKDDRESYLIAGATLAAELVDEAHGVTLFTAVTRQGTPFLWPVKLPTPDGREMLWHTSAREAAAEAMKAWVRVSSNMTVGAYDIAVAEAISVDPQWPAHSFQDLIRIAFRDRIITSLDHPVVKRLRGMV